MGYLISCGWNIEAHRFRLGRHDVDLVARRGAVVAFIEVKTRRSVVCGTALEAVSRPKQRSIAKAAELWRLRFGRPADLYRFDVVALSEAETGRFDIEHVADAWRLLREPQR